MIASIHDETMKLESASNILHIFIFPLLITRQSFLFFIYACLALQETHNCGWLDFMHVKACYLVKFYEHRIDSCMEKSIQEILEECEVGRFKPLEMIYIYFRSTTRNDYFVIVLCIIGS